MATHLAAVSMGKGQRYEIQARPTPKPGPDELLIAVKSIALNPADVLMRDLGIFIPTYPTVVGFDIAGLVVEVGSNLPTTVTDAHSGPCFRPGTTRVAAYAAAAWKSCDPDYGAFQERCLIPWQHAAPLPDAGLSWSQAATLPVSVQVPLSAWDMMGIARAAEDGSVGLTQADTNEGPNEGKVKDSTRRGEALLIWGASSSVGSMGVQTACLLRDDPTSCFAAVFATARRGK